MEELEFNLGVAEDPRTSQEKAKDYQHSDVAGNVIINWVEKTPDQWKKYTEREQDGSLSCCAQSAAKGEEILELSLNDMGKAMVMSAHPIYRSRSNFPDGGMWLQDLGNVCKTPGTTTETLDPSQWMGESALNAPITVATPTKVGGYVMVNQKDIDAVAEAIELHKHCILLVHCNKNEWTGIPEYQPSLPINFGHCICGVDYFLHNGVKTILTEDSTGHSSSFDKKGQRLLTDSFLIGRSSGGMYLTPIPAKFPFTRLLRKGMTGIDVKMLQQLLKDKGYFPQRPTTQFFGQITYDAVRHFQQENHLKVDGVAGPLTIDKLQ